MTAILIVRVSTDGKAGRRLLAPVGMPTAEMTPLDFAVDGAGFTLAHESETGQLAAVIAPAGPSVTLTYRVADNAGPGYPEALFVPRSNRFTRAAADLANAACAIRRRYPEGDEAIAAIANDVARTFTYAHPEIRFNDGMDEVPYLSCGLTEGSCIDINTYLIACLRSAGFEAGYVTGYFFPAEKNGGCDDMHCWVVTRHDGAIRAWDIAHHLKVGALPIRPGLNPKPGTRVAVAHSMGLSFPALGVTDLKLLAEPVWIDQRGRASKADITIRLQADGDPMRAAG